MASSPAGSDPHTAVPPARPYRWFTTFACRAIVLAHQCALVVAGWIGPRRLRPVDPRGLHLLLTGTIHSDNWIRAHVAPLAVARGAAW